MTRVNAVDPELEQYIGRERRGSAKRAVKQASGAPKVVKEKFQEERVVPPLKPMNEKQAEYMRLISQKKLIVATGFAGTSKSFIPTVMACDAYRRGEIKKIYLTRPNISSSKSLGAFTGGVVEKMSNWLMPVLSIMHERLGREVVEIAIKAGDIVCIPLETIKGMSFGKDTFVIGEEAEDLTIDEIKSVLTRQGGCTMVLAGDIEQSALKEKSGLRFVQNMCKKYPELSDTTGFIDFNNVGDIVRSPECKAWIIAMRKEGI